MPEEITTITKDELPAEIRHRQKLLDTYKKNLRLLEEQVAKWGSSQVPAIIAVEIEESKKSIAELEKDLEQLQKADFSFKTESVDSSKEDSKDLFFSPEWSVLRSKVQYVDANLAYRFVDATSDTNILLAFTTLFLGAFLSFVASAILAADILSRTLLWTSAAFSLLITVVFGILSKRADNRAKEVKKQLFPEKLSKLEEDTK